MGTNPPAAPSPPRTKRIRQPVDPSRTGMTPSGQHPITAARAPDLSGRQPGLDADRIDRHHRCLRALPRGTPQARQDLSGVPRTHQFLVTLTVHTNKINPAMTPSRRSATSMTNRHQVVVIQKDGQHRGPRTGLARRGSPRRSPRDQGSLGGSVRAGAGDHLGRRRGRGGRRGRWPATASTPQCGRPTPPARSINSRTRQMSTAMSMGGDPQLLIHTQVRYRGQRRAVSAERQRVSARPVEEVITGPGRRIGQAPSTTFMRSVPHTG